MELVPVRHCEDMSRFARTVFEITSMRIFAYQFRKKNECTKNVRSHNCCPGLFRAGAVCASDDSKTLKIKTFLCNSKSDKDRRWNVLFFIFQKNKLWKIFFQKNICVFEKTYFNWLIFLKLPKNFLKQKYFSMKKNLMIRSVFFCVPTPPITVSPWNLRINHVVNSDVASSFLLQFLSAKSSLSFFLLGMLLCILSAKSNVLCDSKLCWSRF